RRRHTRCYRDWSSDVCSSDLAEVRELELRGVDAELRCGGEIRSALAERIGGTGEPLGGELDADRGVALLRPAKDLHYGGERSHEIGRASGRERGEREEGRGRE